MLAVLSRDWDPIGFGDLLPRDEYDCLTGPVSTLLRRGAGPEALARALEDYRTGHFGLASDLPRDLSAAAALLDWYQMASPPSSG
jgi:hypothetical protein